ncbi:rhamnosyl O-methyltransferase-like [Liolophura sinensis]|uniref:rhamnosyl O-methyltransferase-like n=1 Tax=Liolophura sinensis TaxID=3198878 RepID=UPI0031588CDB
MEQEANKSNSASSFYDSFKDARDKLKNEVPDDRSRYVRMETREDKSAITGEAFQAIKKGKCLTEWQGIIMWKDPLSITIYQSMLWELKPATIIEIGAFRGGSALWLADHVTTFGLKSRVISSDIDLSNLDPKVKQNDIITFIQGDIYKIDEVFPESLLESLPHPWMIIEDSHENVAGQLEYFYKYMVTGDYFVAEDTHHDTIAESSADGGLIHKPNWGPEKMKVLREFCKKHPGDLLVDTRYNDMFGYNGTWNMNGFLRKM